MTNLFPDPDDDPFPSTLDQILAEIAFSIQLPPSLHEKATSRYKAVREYLEGREGFKDQIEHFYPQGSMRVDATISTRGTEDEYDIDIVAQLGGRFRDMSPCEILNELEAALSGYRGLKTSRNTRCVTVHYADNMHLDITPGLRHYNTDERQTSIAHAKGPFERADDRFIPMNAYGFGDWYNERTPTERRVFEAYQRYWMDESRARADAEVDEVPDQVHFPVKSTTTLALQLIKRHRNICYQNETGRIPPSVMLSCFAGHAARPGASLSDMLIRLCDLIAQEIRSASDRHEFLEVRNPRYWDDNFTDRWPSSFQQQDQFARHLENLADGLRQAKAGRMPAWSLRDWLRKQFGDLVVTKAADALAARTGASIRNSDQRYRPDGRLIIPAAAASLTTSSSAVASPKHTFFGGEIKKKP